MNDTFPLWLMLLAIWIILLFGVIIIPCRHHEDYLRRLDTIVQKLDAIKQTSKKI